MSLDAVYTWSFGLLLGDFLRQAFPADHLALSEEGSRRVIDRLADAGIAGGASHDAVIALIAHGHGCELVTLDARAQRRMSVSASPFDS